MRSPQEALADAVEIACATFASGDEGWYEEVLRRNPQDEWLRASAKLAALLTTWRTEQTGDDPEKYLRNLDLASLMDDSPVTIEGKHREEALELAVSLIPTKLTDEQIRNVDGRISNIMSLPMRESGAVFLSLTTITWILLRELAARAYDKPSPDELDLESELGPWLDGFIDSLTKG